MVNDIIDNICSEISLISKNVSYGYIAGIEGLLLYIKGLEAFGVIGDKCHIQLKGDKKTVVCEIIAFRNNMALALPYSSLDGVGLGNKVILKDAKPVLYPDKSWLGRVLNALGEPIDGKGTLLRSKIGYNVRSTPPPAHSRKTVGGKIDLGIKVINSFTTCCKGQRLGIFAGSGVGKSIIFSMMARFTTADIIIIGLVGERGREVQEFLQKDLGAEGLAKSVVVVATSDESALMRRESARTTLTIAEYFRDQGYDVLCLVDSITRFAMAGREIGLSLGEPPASKGYTPTVFAELPKLLERAGPGFIKSKQDINGDMIENGSITGIFTVLVEGDDHNEPISDAVRGIVDGHIILDRAIAHRNRYPAVNVLKSISRMMPDCNSDEENKIINRARELLSIYDDMAELIRLGAYRKGSDAKVDEAIKYYPKIEEFLSQGKKEKVSIQECYQRLAELLDMEYKQQG